MQKSCSKCKATFVCNAQDIQNCQCSTVSLTNETIEKLQATYEDCLCAACLKELSRRSIEVADE